MAIRFLVLVYHRHANIRSYWTPVQGKLLLHKNGLKNPQNPPEQQTNC